MNKHKSYIINLIFPAFIFAAVTGVLTAVVITFYKVCAKYVIAFSEFCYHYLREHLLVVLPILVVLFFVALLFAYIYKKLPNLRGGGIPTSIGILRGVIPFNWFKNLIGNFFLSLTTFLIGVPLGNEGPSVQMGTAVGGASVPLFFKKHKAWERYSMTGGACAGFSVATGAPISGIMFAIEEAHQRISPMIVIVSSASVMFAYITNEILKKFFKINTVLFPKMQLMDLSVNDIWIPIVTGVAVGLFAVLFLKYYNLINKLFNKKLNIPQEYKIFAVFAITVLFGVCSFSFVSTGHELILSLFDGAPALLMLALILLVRSTLTLSANSNGITGGVFLPLLTLGVVLAAFIGKAMGLFFGLDHQYYTIILVLGITACIAGMMKMPITAIVFSIEALSCYNNILYVIIVSCVAYVLTEIFDVKSINENVLENRILTQNEGRKLTVIDTFVTVQKDSFAAGKQIRDIFWPANLFVLSVQHDKTYGAEVDGHGAKTLYTGDVLHIRYSTFDELKTKEELIAVVGQQEYPENQTDVI